MLNAVSRNSCAILRKTDSPRDAANVTLHKLGKPILKHQVSIFCESEIPVQFSGDVGKSLGLSPEFEGKYTGPRTKSESWCSSCESQALSLSRQSHPEALDWVWAFDAQLIGQCMHRPMKWTT